MKRVLLTMLCLSVLLTGCAGAKKHVDPVSDVPEPSVNTAEATAPDATEPTTAARPIAERIAGVQTAGTYLYDEQGVLTEEERSHYNDYLAQLSASHLIHAAAVITDSLGGETPEAFAQEYYRALFGDAKSSGYLVLVNNDTGVDYIYAENACEPWLSDTTFPIAQATPLLVEGKYADALDILLAVGEYLPEWVFDDAGVLAPEEVQTLENLADGGKIAVLITPDAPQVTTETTTAASETTAQTETSAQQAPSETASVSVPEEWKRFAEERRAECGMDALLVLDTVHGAAWIAGKTDETRSAQLQSILQTQGAYQAALDYLQN